MFYLFLGGKHAPIPKFLGLDSKRGFLTVLGALPAACGAGAGFLPGPLALGWSLRREQLATGK
jgi:hypothetical protein